LPFGGVGTRLVTAYDQPALGGVYKLGGNTKCQKQVTGIIKLNFQKTPIKTSNPGKIGVVRAFDAMGQPLGDLLYNELMG
jgi:nicotinate phosphoribosyltransferase